MGEHLIAREIIEVVAGDRDLAGALADRVAAAAPLVAATLKRHFDAAEDGHRRRIERLVLALDPCDPADFEASLVANLDAALGRALPRQLARIAAIDPAEDALDLIAAFLRTGSLPWWTSGRATALAEATETLVLAANSQNSSLIAALRHLLRETDSAIRLVHAVPEPLLPRLAACLAGLRADELDLLAIVLTAQQRDGDLGAGVAQVWSSIIVAAAHKAPLATPEEFADEVRAHLGRADGSGEAQPSQTSGPPPGPDPLEPRAANEPSRPIHRPADGRKHMGHDEERAAADEPSQPIDGPAEGRKEDMGRDTGGQPAADEPPQPIHRPAEGRKDDRGRDPEEPAKDARPVESGRSHPAGPEFRPAREQPGDLTSAEAVPPPVVVDPATANPLDTPSRGTIGTNEDGEAHVPPLSRDLRPTGAEPVDHFERPFVRNAAGHRSASTRPVEGAERRAEAKTAAEHDSLYIEAAGIVMFGPFLPDCFAAAGLTAFGGGFVTPEAQHRAVALIDYLATADPDPPEWRLGLAKLLAGMPIDTIVASGPVDDVEAAAVDSLLAAVLAELPMLGQLTVGGFRSAWLNRPGLLTVEHGEWLLRIERRGWDVLLERLPWSIGWLQLPWQREGIRVEW